MTRASSRCFCFSRIILTPPRDEYLISRITRALPLEGDRHAQTIIAPHTLTLVDDQTVPRQSTNSIVAILSVKIPRRYSTALRVGVAYKQPPSTNRQYPKHHSMKRGRHGSVFSTMWTLPEEVKQSKLCQKATGHKTRAAIAVYNVSRESFLAVSPSQKFL